MRRSRWNDAAGAWSESRAGLTHQSSAGSSEIAGMRILIIKLGATGDVVRTTPLLRRFRGSIGWITAERDVWEIPNYLCEIPHTRIFSNGIERSLAKMDDRLYKAGRLGGMAH